MYVIQTVPQKFSSPARARSPSLAIGRRRLTVTSAKAQAPIALRAGCRAAMSLEGAYKDPDRYNLLTAAGIRRAFECPDRLGETAGRDLSQRTPVRSAP